MKTLRYLLVTLGLVACAAAPALDAKDDHIDQDTGKLDNEDLLCLAANLNGQPGVTSPSSGDLCRSRPRWLRTRVEIGTDLKPYAASKIIALITSENSGLELPANPPGTIHDPAWQAYGDAFADWAKRIVLAHEGQIGALEILNEPNAVEQGALTPVASAIIIARTYNAVRPILPPDVPILLPGPVGDWLPYLAKMVAALRQIQPRFGEGLAIHPYNGPTDDSSSPSAMIGKVRDAFRTVRMPIWLTEFGDHSGWGKDPATNHEGIQGDEADVARNLVRYYRALDELTGPHGELPGAVKTACWFAWEDHTHFDPANEAHGLVSREAEPEPHEDGLRTLRKRGCAFRNLARPLCTNDLSPPSCPEGDPAVVPFRSPTRWVVRGATTGDFTGDGFADFADHRIVDGAFWIHENKKNGTFAPEGVNWGTGFTASSSDIEVLVGDFTGDGFADYADHLRADGNFWIHENKRDGTFTGPGVNWGTGRTKAGPRMQVLVGDFTGDGFADYADHDTKTGMFVIHENLKNGTFATADWGSGTSGDFATFEIIVGDFTGDGFVDFADRRRTDGRMWIHENLKNGTFATKVWGETVTATGDDMEVVIGDFTGDKFADFADRRRSDGLMWIHENLKNGTFAGSGVNWGIAQTVSGEGHEILGSAAR